MVLRNLAIPPTPFSTEVFFLSEAALSQTDPFCILPAAIGTMAMLNTEIRRALLPASVDGAADLSRFARAVDSLARGFSVLIVSFAMTNPIVRIGTTRKGVRLSDIVSTSGGSNILDDFVHLHFLRERYHDATRKAPNRGLRAISELHSRASEDASRCAAETSSISFYLQQAPWIEWYVRDGIILLK